MKNLANDNQKRPISAHVAPPRSLMMTEPASDLHNDHNSRLQFTPPHPPPTEPQYPWYCPRATPPTIPNHLRSQPQIPHQSFPPPFRVARSTATPPPPPFNNHLACHLCPPSPSPSTLRRSRLPCVNPPSPFLASHHVTHRQDSAPPRLPRLEVCPPLLGLLPSHRHSSLSNPNLLAAALHAQSPSGQAPLRHLPSQCLPLRPQSRHGRRCHFRGHQTSRR